MERFLFDVRQGEHCVYWASVQTRVYLLDLLYFYLILRNISLLDVSVVTDRVVLHI